MCNVTENFIESTVALDFLILHPSHIAQLFHVYEFQIFIVLYSGSTYIHIFIYIPFMYIYHLYKCDNYNVYKISVTNNFK